MDEEKVRGKEIRTSMDDTDRQYVGRPSRFQGNACLYLEQLESHVQ